MKILNVQNIYTNKFSTPKISFKSNNDDTHAQERIDRKEFYKDNYNDAFNKEYEPIKYEKTTMVHGKPGVSPSVRMFKQNQSTLRENELFYDDVDSVDFVPTKYDTDDVPLDSSLWMRPFRRLFSEYAPDTYIPAESFGDCYEALYNPWKNVLDLKAEEEKEKYEYLIYKELSNIDEADYKTIKEIFKSSSILKKGKNDVDFALCNLAIKLYRNSKTWDETEKAIMDEIKIPIYKKVYGDYSSKKYECVDKCIKAGYSNEGILDFLQDFYSGYVIDLSSIMTKEDVEKYNKSIQKATD